MHKTFAFQHTVYPNLIEASTIFHCSG